MRDEQEAIEQFIVEAAVEGLNEIFCEGSIDREGALQIENPRLMKIKAKINDLLAKYWDLQVEINGGSLRGNSEQDKNAKRSASLATLHFMEEICEEYRNSFRGEPQTV